MSSVSGTSSLSASVTYPTTTPHHHHPSSSTTDAVFMALAGGGEGMNNSSTSPFIDPDFNVRQWVNMALPASLANNNNNTVAPSSKGTGISSTTTSSSSAAAVERRAAELITHLQLRSQEVTANLDDAITQTLVRMPRAVAEVSRMGVEAKRLKSKIGEIKQDLATSSSQPEKGADNTSGTVAAGEQKEVVASSPTKEKVPTSSEETKEVEHLQSTKEKLVWCHNVLKTAQTLSVELRELESALDALGKGSMPSPRGGGGGGGMGDIEHIASLTRNLNKNLQQLQAVDASFGHHYAQRIAASEKNLQSMVEREILETVTHRSSLEDVDVAHTDNILVEIKCLALRSIPSTASSKRTAGGASSTTFLEIGTTSLHSVDTPTVLANARRAAESIQLKLISSSQASRMPTAGGDLSEVSRTAKLLSILRAIDRDEVVIDAFVNSGVEKLVAKFHTWVVEPFSASSSSPPQLSALLMRFYFYLGVSVAKEVDYLSRLYLASLLSGRASGLQSGLEGSEKCSSGGNDAGGVTTHMPGIIGKQSSTLNGTGDPSSSSSAATANAATTTAAPSSLSDLEALVMDAVSLMTRTTIEKIAGPLRDALKKLTGSSSAANSTNTTTSNNEELVRCFEAASLFVDFGAELLLTSADMKISIGDTTSPNGGGGSNKGGPTPQIAKSDVSSSLRVMAMVPKALGVTAGRGYLANVEVFVTKERLLLESHAKALSQQQQQQSSTMVAIDDDRYNVASVLSNGRGLMSCIEGTLTRCSRFFPQETVHPVLNTWSRQVAGLLLHVRKPAADVSQAVKSASAKGGEEGLRQQAQLKDQPTRRFTVERLIALYGAVRSLYALLISVEGRSLQQFIAQGSSSKFASASGGGASSSNAVVEADVLQEIFKQAEKECIKTIRILEAAITSVLLSPLHCSLTQFVKMPSLLVGKGNNLTSNGNSKGPSPLPNNTKSLSAQSTHYSAGNSVYSPVAQAICDFLLEVPDVVEALAMILERASTLSTTTATTSSASTAGGQDTTMNASVMAVVGPGLTVDALLSAVLKETQSMFVHRVSTELVALHSQQSLEQLAVDLEYITPVLEAVREEGAATVHPSDGGNGDEGGMSIGGGDEDVTPSQAFDALVRRVREANDAQTVEKGSAVFPMYLVGHHGGGLATQQQQQQQSSIPTSESSAPKSRKRD